MQTIDPRDAVPIVVGIVSDRCGRLLVGCRPPNKPYSGKWEFPGGKVEFGETAWEALVREFDEEVGLLVQAGQRLFNFRYTYADICVALDVWHVTRFDGVAVSLEGQEIRWLQLEELDHLDFLGASQELISRVRLLDQFVR